jgi:hypothetical protein
VGESVGQIVFINSHDYVSDVKGTDVVGCLASLATQDGAEVALYTRSLRLQNTLEMAYATKSKVAVDYFDVESESVHSQQSLIGTADRGAMERKLLGPFNLKAIWTVE